MRLRELIVDYTNRADLAELADEIEVMANMLGYSIKCGIATTRFSIYRKESLMITVYIFGRGFFILDSDMASRFVKEDFEDLEKLLRMAYKML